MQTMITPKKDPNEMSFDEFDDFLDRCIEETHEAIRPLLMGQRVQRFIDGFSLGEPQVSRGGFWLYASGAERDNDPVGPLKYPPTDRNERWKLIKVYWELRLKAATKEFNQQKSQMVALVNAATNVRAPHCKFTASEASLDELKRLAGIVRRIQVKLSAVSARIEATKPPHEVQREECDAASRVRATQFLADISAITI